MKLAAAAACLVIGGCGGGGGAGTSAGPAPTPTAAYNLDAAVANALTKGWATNSLSAQIFGQPYTMTVSFTPSSDGTIFGKTLKRAGQDSYVWQGGIGAHTVNSTLYFTTAPTNIAYIQDNLNANNVTAYTLDAALPTAATVGQSGTWAHGVVYPSVTVTDSVLSTATTTWSLEPDAAATAWGCLTFTQRTVAVGLVTTEKDCYRIDAAGNISGAKFTGDVNGQMVTFQ